MQPYSSKPIPLTQKIKQWGFELGFADVGISETDLSEYETHYFNWIGENFHGEMEYMARHGNKRTRPAELEPGTLSVISVRLNYLDLNARSPFEQLHDPEQAYISRYALGKDYHKLVRKRLQQLAEKISQEIPDFRYRAFCDSAPVLERPLAQKAGLGFIGKNSLIIHPRAGSWFFLGELYTNLPLQPDKAFEKQGCGPCTACIDECPTGAIIDNAVVDARKCISYLTIEYAGSIPLELRSKMGNRIYGCDDCQLVCPWNKFTAPTQETAFQSKQQLDSANLFELWKWNETQFLKNFEGSPIRRIGYPQWKRNLAIALGNITGTLEKLEAAEKALQPELGCVNDLVDEHIEWALNAINSRKAQFKTDKTVRSSEIEPSMKTNPQPFKAPKYYLPKS
ncbi:tRNA epoxyqueuosine(34) reductase QueG [Thiomicrorhabdus sp.]|uniref:tRNA epoxyqueuosine(34) reductase QueG n=1 Tax=Thiomicrorhabdus sp. TaxID=2039724 RepID=UPI003561C5C6